MTEIERRLARELRDAAADIDAGSVPPLVLPRGQARRGSARAGTARPARWGHLTPRMLAPLAAAASVLAVAAGAVALSSLSRTGDAPATRDSVLRSVPRYYIALAAPEPATPKVGHAAGIYATGTGALLASIRAPSAYPAFVGVSAAADDRTFALAARAYPHGGRAAVTFYLASFRPGDRSVSLTGITAAQVPAGASFDGFALSPDGRSLAFAYERSGTDGAVTEVLKVLDLATGTARTWTSAHGNVAGAGLGPQALTWSANGRTLAFAWYGTGAGPRGTTMLATTGLRLLRIGNPSPGLVSSSRRSIRLYNVAGHPDPLGFVPTSAILAPGGQVVAAAGTNQAGTAGGFAEFSAVSGRRVRTLWWKHLPSAASGQAMTVLWASESGGTLVVSGPPGHPGRVAVLRDDRLILLPGSSRIALPTAAW
jgi:WD40-like Beta Propeller Repeat